MMKTISIEQLKEKRRQGTIEMDVPFLLNGEMTVVKKKIVNGEMETYELGKPVGEMMTNATTRKEFLQKVVLDVEMGKEEVPTLYGPIYDRIEDSNFPREFEAKWAQYGNVIFFEHAEGEEVKFGSLSAEQGPIAQIKGYSAGFEYTKEIQMFNQTFNLELLNRAFGEAYNAMLNHMHLFPIFKNNYKTANKTGPVYVDSDRKELQDKTGSHYLLSLRETIKQGLTATRTAKRPATILLANSADQYDLEEAMASFTINATPHKAVSGVDTIIYYDGWETNVGKKSYAYDGVPAGKVFAVRPKRGFKELIKQDMQINATMGDASRLVESQVIGDFWRGVFAAVDENVQEITLPGK
ncbi:aspartate ammonia-lyase [Virgibacillus halodenitrificans]|uniref:hypothetical protein n=1 Tax=Virgibacillus halodenitrificans TaxID=1482 RepID=UPI001370D29B|nr:hypothetical protein [Virgibacillus halodenitrificans]MYL45049.1 aspartate ammonia-lyase [Virgibacillus halodenitrificans]